MLLPFFEWCESTVIASTIQNSLWLFPVIEAVHLLGLCLLGGSILLVDLRLMGFGLIHQSISELNRQVRPWLLVAVIVMIATGVPLFLSEAIKCYYNRAFWVKITTLPLALAFTFLVRNRIARADSKVAYINAATGAISVVLWFVVAAAGRWIGYS
ncbi:MAG: hypothetical protein OSB36_06300 [Longimicrobiales bacterium]|nr:hypothetical protein [Longimicrobiales bacterium]